MYNLLSRVLIIIFLSLSNLMFAVNTAGSMLHMYPPKFHHANLNQLSSKSDEKRENGFNWESDGQSCTSREEHDECLKNIEQSFYVEEQTNQEPITVLEEKFDTAPFPPTGWTQTITNPNNTWERGNVEKNNFSSINSSSQSSAICPFDDNVVQQEWLFSPLISLPNGTASLEFYSGYSTDWLSWATMSCWISIDEGQNWTPLWEAINDGLDWGWRKQEIDLSSFTGNQNVYLAWGYVGQGGDIVALDDVKLTTNSTVAVEYTDDNPTSFTLEQNFPNPFNPTTTIYYYMPFESQVEITIYDLMGQKVDTIVNDYMDIGNHKINWDGKDNFGRSVSGGIYIYKLQTVDFNQSRKMVLIK